MFKVKEHSLPFHHRHKTHSESLFKFLALIAIVISYFLYMSWKYDAATSFGLSILTWSFFCTLHSRR